MENWGLIIGRTSEILWDPKKSSSSDKKWVIDMVSHECAHMWFGNIVTPEWWTGLWLNEAFASLMGEVVIPGRVFPEYNALQEFLTYHWFSALRLDGLRSSHPIEVDCPDANRATEIFDAISYSKGASVLRMLSTLVGEEKFLQGVSTYLKKHLLGNTITSDLWKGIQEASGVDVSKIMKEWTLQPGFPVIIVQHAENNHIRVKQSRFLATGDTKPEEDHTLWFVPLAIKTVNLDGSSSVQHQAILQDREATFKIAKSRAFKLNAETIGTYRVAYSAEQLSALGEEASRSDSGFTTEDRIGLVSDAMTLAAAGYGKTSGALNLFFKLSGILEFRVWEAIQSSLKELGVVWREQRLQIQDAFDNFRIRLYQPILESLGWDFNEGEDHATVQLRILAIDNLASAKDDAVIAELQRRFESYLKSGVDSQTSPELQATIFLNAVKYGDEEEYNKVREVYDNPSNPVAKVDAIYALGATNNCFLIQNTFDMIGDGSIAEQDVG
jgi:aminopeptidase 2